VKVHYTFRIEGFEDICATNENLAPRVRRSRFASMMAGLLLSVSPFLAAPGLWPPDKFLLGMEPMALILFVCAFQNARRRARKVYAAAVTDKEYEATIDDGGVTTSSPVGRGEMKWEAFQRVIEGDEAIALVADAMMYVFPKRAFTSSELEEFKELIASHIPVWDGKTRTIRLL
jgi:YcxB-like protein